jgi:hypothetical protein
MTGRSAAIRLPDSSASPQSHRSAFHAACPSECHAARLDPVNVTSGINVRGAARPVKENSTADEIARAAGEENLRMEELPAQRNRSRVIDSGSQPHEGESNRPDHRPAGRTVGTLSRLPSAINTINLAHYAMRFPSYLIRLQLLHGAGERL